MEARKRRRWRWLVGVPLGTALLLSGTYAYLTNPARLRTQALAALRALGPDEAEVGEVFFSPRQGIRVADLVLGAGQDEGAARLHVSDATLTCDWLSLLRGRFRPRTMRVGYATLALPCDSLGSADDDLSDALEDETRELLDLLWRVRKHMPRIDIDRLDLQLLVTPQGRPQLLERRLLRVTGRRTDDTYALRLETPTGAAPPVAELLWQLGAGQLSLRLDGGDLETFRPVLPPRVLHMLEATRLCGRARVERLAFTAAPRAAATSGALRFLAAELQLDELRGIVPIENAETLRANTPPFLQFMDGSLRVTYARDEHAAGELTAAGQARLNGAACMFELTADGRLLAGLRDAAPANDGSAWTHVRSAVLRVSELDLPTHQSHPAFVSAARLPSAVRSAFDHYQPCGKVNLSVRLLPPDGADGDLATRLAGELEPLGTSCRYYEFPYAFHDARGRLLLRDGALVLDDLCARHGAAWVCAQGRVNNSRSWSGFDLVFRGRNVPLNEELHAALPPNYRTLWEAAAPIGLSDVTAHVRRDEGTPEAGPSDTEIRVDARLLSGSLVLAERRRLAHVDGRLTIAGGIIQIHDLHGHDGPTTVRQSGRAWTAAGHPGADVRLELAGVPVEEEAALTGDAQTPARVRFRGRADAWGRVHTSEPDGTRRQHFAVQITEGELQALDPARRWTDSTGWLVLRDGEQRIVSFSCRQGDAWFDAAGVVPAAGAPRGPLALTLSARGNAVEALLPQFVPGDWQKLVDALGLAGAGEVNVTLRPTDAAPLETGQRADVRLRAAQMQAAALPLGLRDVVAHVVLNPDSFEVRSSTAQWGPSARIRAQGSGAWTEDRVDAEFNIAAEGLHFCPELNAALPAPLARLVERLGLVGEFDALLDQVQMSGPAPARTWLVRGRLPLRAAALHMGLQLSELDGELQGVCRVAPQDEIDLDAEFHIRSARIADRPMADWYGLLSHRTGDRWVRLDDLRGRLCGGDAIGNVWIDADTSDYEVSLTLKDVSLHELFPPRKETTAPPRRGRLDATLHLRGRGNQVSTRRGGGDLRLRGATFLHTPVLASVSEAGAKEGAARDDVVERADVRFLWEGAVIRLTRVDIHGHDLRLVGEGWWNLRDDTIGITLVGAHPEHWPRLLGLTDLLESAGQELVQYHVRGTLDAPTVTAEPLYRLNEALRALITGGGD